ncbi:glycine N-methyltransferase [Fopius arisanus]|uniref:Glycine N-methyltransferase n=2 Tax=Fopius arisanus TaxID=64838 RepID=A0A0C9RHR0_9HYME|nr:PREDICTED: glycine N-methyltransferase [Fopius arisanus]XP_011308306.1 PREDICTED: glycine N-methyltransferase [Fopius arisanus]
MNDEVLVTRSRGAAAEGVRDQYADGKAAKVWSMYIGDKKKRTQNYKDFLVGILRKRGCKRILDVACGTGVDSVMLLEEGFEVVSVDASDKMLKYALKSRWERRKESAFDNWVIEEANWLTLTDDIVDIIGDGFDAVICLGNSFAHMPDNFGDQREQKQALRNFEKCVKPGGLLLIDHRNYDHIISRGETQTKCIYYSNEHVTDIKTSVLFVAGKPQMVIMDYMVTLDSGKDNTSDFRLSYYPHLLKVFHQMLAETFGPDAKHDIYADFMPLEVNDTPGFYIHMLEKSM